MGTAIGVTVERMRAYESEAKRFGAELLFEVATVLQCRAMIFFEDMAVWETKPKEMLHS